MLFLEKFSTILKKKQCKQQDLAIGGKKLEEKFWLFGKLVERKL